MDYLSISALNSFAFCRRLFYYREIEQIEAENYYLVDGQLKHERVDGESGEFRKEDGKMYGVTMHSEHLGISGRFDVLEIRGENLFPVEYKRGEAGEWLNHRVQICAQGLLLEDVNGQPVEYGYIYYYGSKKRQQVIFDAELREHTLQLIAEAKAFMQQPSCPEVTYTRQCEGCSMIHHCLPEEVEHLHTNTGALSKKVLPRLDDREVLYITTSDVSIGKQSNRLIIKEEDKVIKEVPLIKVSKVVIFGSVNVTHPVIALLMKNNIEVVYVNYYGMYEGTLIPPENRNGLMRKKQVLGSASEETCVYLSRQFVIGKIHNMRVFLQRRNRESKDVEVAIVVKELKGIAKKLAQVQTLDGIRGEEGYATKLYFQSLNRFLAKGFHYTKRTRRPPEDPINALLSLGYSLLTKDIEGCCRVIGLDPYTGFLHGDRYGKPSLALDLMEEFRPLIVDQIVLYALNSGIVTEDDFEEVGQIRLSQKGLKKFLAQYEQRKKTELTHPVFGYQTTYQRAFEIQARMLGKYLTGEIAEYIPLQIR